MFASINGTATHGAVVATPQTQITISAVAQAGGNTTFTYALVFGPALDVGQTIVLYNLPAGDDGTFYITGVGAGTFTAANAGGVANPNTNGNGVTEAATLQ
jgi:hypothetical protein